MKKSQEAELVPTFFVRKRLHPTLEWTSPHHRPNNEVCRVVRSGSGNDSFVSDGQGDGPTAKHPDGNGVEATPKPPPVRQLHSGRDDQLNTDPKKVTVLGFATQLVALQRGTRPISDILGQRTQQ